ncbi:unnamed protein product [Clonostachys chloroleuca]|uniref:Uncharacterized protein n=1 Tax=Clonostachys chloroleuca TaxID=1926264 RepID=A0AA35MA19_9HYPO|nr:unnamed protein product [Clonostachys chloroleuca]
MAPYPTRQSYDSLASAATTGTGRWENWEQRQTGYVKGSPIPHAREQTLAAASTGIETGKSLQNPGHRLGAQGCGFEASNPHCACIQCDDLYTRCGAWQCRHCSVPRTTMAAAGRALSYEHGLGCEGLGYLAGDATTVPSAATTKAWQQRETTNRGWWGLWHPFGTLCHPLQPAGSAAHSLPEVPIPLPQARLCLSVRVFSASWSPHLTTPSILRDPSALHCACAATE